MKKPKVDVNELRGEVNRWINGLATFKFSPKVQKRARDWAVIFRRWEKKSRTGKQLEHLLRDVQHVTCAIMREDNQSAD